MKALYTLIFIFAVFSLSYSQTHIETYYREYCYWNYYTEKYDDCDGYAEFSTFDISEDWSYWVHTTPIMQSTYYVLKTEYNEDYELTYYYVESDAGNNYIYVFDIMNNEIRIFGVNKEDEPFILTFYVSAWE
ncbi:MAG: hypothetical protein N2490_03860 [Ignavibacteria bacterium]|nr:hypothetical protein [Ignavibacteria bacterium]